MINKGFWLNYGPKYFKITNKGYCGLGIKAFMKERFTNGFKFIQNDQLAQRIFKKVDNQNHETQIASNGVYEMESELFKFFDSQIDKSLIDQQKDAYINLVKNMFQHAQSGQNE